MCLLKFTQINTIQPNKIYRKKMNMLIKKPDINDLVTHTVLNTKSSEVENKIPDNSGIVTTTVLNTKIGEVENKIPDLSALSRKQIITLKY